MSSKYRVRVPGFQQLRLTAMKTARTHKRSMEYRAARDPVYKGVHGEKEILNHNNRCGDRQNRRAALPATRPAS
jgi:hypothetical protein